MPEPKHPAIGDLTSNQVKVELNCGEAKFWDLVNNKELHAYKLGRVLRITRKSLDDYKQRHRYVQRKDLKGTKGSMMLKRKRPDSPPEAV